MKKHGTQRSFLVVILIILAPVLMSNHGLEALGEAMKIIFALIALALIAASLSLIFTSIGLNPVKRVARVVGSISLGLFGVPGMIFIVVMLAHFDDTMYSGFARLACMAILAIIIISLINLIRGRVRYVKSKKQN